MWPDGPEEELVHNSWQSEENNPKELTRTRGQSHAEQK